MTEYDGLRQLKKFLLRHNGSGRAASMLDSLTFIGEKEYTEGAAGLAAYWKRYLDSDPGVQLCALAYISRGRGQTKSDAYLLERILENFSDQELKKYKGRLLVELSALSVPPDKAKVILLDDWVISGSTMTTARKKVLSDGPSPTDKEVGNPYQSSLEVNLLVASRARLEDGLEPTDTHPSTTPVKAYFMSHQADGYVQYVVNGGYNSGTHSAVDFDFTEVLAGLSGQYGSGLPALARVIRPYYGDSSRPLFNKIRKMSK
jgi:hypothetical protein